MRILQIENEKGTSLLELMVAISLFSVITLASTQIFKMVTDGQRSAVSAQNVQENMRYALEKISKEIRTAGASNGACKDIFKTPPAAVNNKVFNVYDANNNVLYFKNKNGECVAYYLDSSRLKITVDNGVDDPIDDFITPEKIAVSNLKFSVADDPIGAFHSLQPLVTMAMDVEAVGLALHKQKMKLQTTVSSRYYE